MPTKPLHSVVFSAPAVESPWQTSLVLQWPTKGKTPSLCVCALRRCMASQAACWRRCLYSGTPRGFFSATTTSSPHILSTLFRQQVETEPIKWFSVCFPSFLSFTSSSLMSWSQRQASSASSADSQRSSGDCSPSPHRAQLVRHNKTMFLDFH